MISDEIASLFIDYEISFKDENGKEVYNIVTPSMAHLIALSYIESPLVGGDSKSLSPSLKLLSYKSDTPTVLLEKLSTDDKDIKIVSEEELVLIKEHISKLFEVIETWPGDGKKSQLGASYIIQLKVLAQSKLNYTEMEFYKANIKKITYEILAINELDSGEQIIVSERDKKDMKLLKEMKENGSKN